MTDSGAATGESDRPALSGSGKSKAIKTIMTIYIKGKG
jgi:hypothetical protein